MSSPSSSPAPSASPLPPPSISRLALIGGSSFLDSSALHSFQLHSIATPFGTVQLRANASQSVWFVQRHAAEVDPKKAYSPPHLINYRAIIKALQQVNVSHVIAFGSTGSLKKTLPVGSLLVPDDWMHFSPISTFDYSKGGHVGTGLDASLRSAILSLLRSNNYQVLDSGVYAQTSGPRFETPAEIRSLAVQGGDIVGMTCAHEATLCRELGLPYAVICIVDNMANGIAGTEISYEEFHAGVARNLVTMERILKLVLQQFTPTEAVVPLINGASENKEAVDSLVHARWIVPIIPPVVLENHSMAVRDGRIVAVLPTSEAKQKYTARNEEEFNDSVVMPGFVNAHTHLGMSLMRGYADDYCLSEWLTKHIWPGEAKFVSPEFVQDSCELGLAEMIRGGTTACNDMYWFPDVFASLCDKVGFRALIGLILIDFPTNYAKSVEEYFEKGLKLYQQMKHHPLISFSLSPHAPYTVADENLAKVKDLADKVVLRNAQQPGVEPLSVPARIHIHLHETASEVNDSETHTPSMACHRSKHKCRPLHNLDANLHMLNEQLIAVHMTQLNKEEIARVAETKTNVVHCPTSNLKLASGFCPIAALTASNANVALGTDSTASNNSLDMWSEIKLSAILAKTVANDPTAIPAYQALKMATYNGAVALGLESQIGSLEVGKQADFIRVRMSGIESIPLFDVHSHLCYVSGREHVSDVWIAGRRVLRDRQLTTLDEAAIKARTLKWQQTMSEEKKRQAAEAEAADNANNANGKKRPADETAEQSAAVKAKH